MSYFGTSMEDSISSQTSVLICTSSTSVQNIVFCYEYLFYYSSEIIDHDGTFPWPPEYVLHEFLLKSHEKQSNGKSWKRRFCKLSKLVYFKTQLLELVEFSMAIC